MTRRRHSTCHLHHSFSGVCSACLRHRLSLLQLDARVCEDESEDESMKKTMKEHIDLEFDQPRRKSVWSASAFTDKLHNKWKPKQFNKNKPDNVEAEADPVENKSTVVMRRRSCDTDFRVLSIFDLATLKQRHKENPNNVEVESKNVEKKSMSRRSCDTDFRVLSICEPARLNQRDKENPNNVEVESKNVEKKSMSRRSCDTDFRVLSIFDLATLKQRDKKNPNNVEAKNIEKKSMGRRSCDTDFRVSSIYEPARLNQHDEKNPNNVEVESKNVEKKSMSRRSCDTDFRVLSIFDPSRLMQREKKNPNTVEVGAKTIEKKSPRRRSCDTESRVSSVYEQHNKKNPNNVEVGAKSIEKKSMGRRSCDTDLRVLSVVDEPARASWDGYMIARTIPRLAPMLSVIENAMMNEQMLMEDFETNSVSESSSSQRRNSFDCSSSGKSSSKHRAPIEIDHVQSVLPVAKIVVKGDMGFDLYKDNGKNADFGVKNSDSFKRKMLKIMGFKSKSGDPIEVSREKVVGKNADVCLYDLCNKSRGIGENRGDKSRSVRYSSSPINLENGLSLFQLKPSLSRSEKPERKSMLGVSRG